MYIYVQKLNCKIRFLVILLVYYVMLRNLHQIVVHGVCNFFKTWLIYSPVEILENLRFHNENINFTAR